MSEQEDVHQQAVEKYLTQIKARKSEHTFKQRRTTLKQFREFISPLRDVLDVDSDDIDDWLNHLSNDDYSDKTILNKAYDLSHTYDFFESRGYIDNNPWGRDNQNIDLDWLSNEPEIDSQSDVRFLDEDEFQAILDACEKPRNRLIHQLLWSTGVRAEEACKIEISDINEYRDNPDTDDDGTVIRKIEVSTGKQQSDAKREVYYGQDLAHELRNWLERGARASYLFSGDSDRLLLTKQSDRMPPNRLAEIVDETAEKAGVQEYLWVNQRGQKMRRVTPHTFRHSYAVHRVKNGMPIVFLQDLLGHADIEQTRVYLKFRNEQKREADRRYRP